MAAAQRARSAAADVDGETSGSRPGMTGPLYGPVGRFCVVQSLAVTLPLAVQYCDKANCDRLRRAQKRAGVAVAAGGERSVRAQTTLLCAQLTACRRTTATSCRSPHTNNNRA